MPTYDYRCKDCGELTIVVHGLKEKLENCFYCSSTNVFKTIAPFSAKTENTQEHRFRIYQEQGLKDLERFHKDDNFAANITGYGDEGSAERMRKHLKEMQDRNEKSRKSLKKEE